ncbi:hypothetical protein L0F51_04005 [Afifella sp. H1R]|nr:hypothetical protein [Afifella sp. H1R]MCF1502929.1 hypothetical protein [Afifella sp. H1R]
MRDRALAFAGGMLATVCLISVSGQYADMVVDVVLIAVLAWAGGVEDSA